MEKEIIVVKYGSSSVTNDNGMDIERVERNAEQLASLMDRYSLIIVSSGSIAVGRMIWRDFASEIELEPEEQPLAMLGSADSFVAWRNALLQHNILSGQLLISHREIDDSREGPMLQKVLQQNRRLGIVTIANENDAVSELEIKKLSYGGDNDGLASRLARLVGAKHLLLMTDVEGLLDRDGKLVRTVDKSNISEACLLAEGAGKKGRGGMFSKVKAADKAAQRGISAAIGSADADIQAILSGQTGTHFTARIRTKS